MKNRLLAIVILGLAFVAGCTTTPTQESSTGAAGQSNAEGAAAGQPAESQGAQAGGSQFQGSPLQDPNSPLYKKVFYFPFDSSEIAAADKEVLAAHAKFLAANPRAKVTVEGNCDERGTREYNLALGERRAQAVQRVLTLQGTKKDQTKLVSYGEERPAANGHDESAWQLNRRVELVYSGV